MTAVHVRSASTWSELLEVLRAAVPGETFVSAADAASCADEVDVAIVEAWADGLGAYPHLALVQSLWAGVDRLLADPQLPPGVAVARMVSAELTQLMAEYVVASVLYVHRQFPAYARQQRSQAWAPLMQRAAADTPVGILGAGELAQASAVLLRAVGFPVTMWARRLRADDPSVRVGEEGFSSVVDAAVVVNLLPLTDATRGVLDARALARFRDGAAFVNVGRGAHVDEVALLAALDRGAISHAVLDVFNNEPLPPDSRLWAHQRVTVTPHVAADSTVHAVGAVAAEAVRAFRAGEPVANTVERARGY